ncbi:MULTISPECIES: glycerol-3-phosphate 1-O-acyltransferase PlsY [unclassified Butyrivibrio]|uniref:glycerol-3-phosphate 1-O-acyltransferase PlsY n=1 Tax=unclassified Butyrivibrio TaxID=2639466 RepID=UPI0003B4D370|nr:MULTISPECIES: glycerol-3-phosphate 1-O-acyltransferase PlsY [unclassified Butyrivibrio]SDB48684.1 glycerol-3-phosphate acyltransferase PlsY [Butyrivibrio sp. INlla16]SEK46446.1 glycerol-3-phosphate acyltransferase PlsY [Butyrivibrio sp. ob235]
MIARVLCLLIGYAFGLIQTAVIYCRMKGVDIRNVGSGNAGTTNTLRVLGAKAGFTVLFGDMLKCIAAVVVSSFLCKMILGDGYGDMKYLLKIYTAAGCVLGHDFPFYMKFKGGKGIACTAGYILAFKWTFVIGGLLAFLIPFNITHFVSLGSLCLYAVFFIQLVVEGQMGLLNMSQPHLIEMYIIAFAMTALAFYQHRTNIGRLIRGEERKTYIWKKNKVD